jgi:DNA-binding Lrp family transcriptional regulator
VPDIAGYERFLHGVAFKLPGVSHVRSSVVLKEVKAETRLPISAGDAVLPPAAARAAPRAARQARA